MLELNEIQTLETAINCAVKQMPFMMMSAMIAAKQGSEPFMTVKELLETNITYIEALNTIEKLKELCKNDLQ